MVVSPHNWGRPNHYPSISPITKCDLITHNIGMTAFRSKANRKKCEPLESHHNNIEDRIEVNFLSH
jgi:hypothetical protein